MNLEFGANELIFNNDKESGIHSGGFSVSSMMMKRGIPPIKTLNTNQLGGSNVNVNVSDLFSDLVLPNWAFTHYTMNGGKNKDTENNDKDQQNNKKYESSDEEDESSDEEDDVIDEDLHNELLKLVKHNDKKEKHKFKITKKNKEFMKQFKQNKTKKYKTT